MKINNWLRKSHKTWRKFIIKLLHEKIIIIWHWDALSQPKNLYLNSHVTRINIKRRPLITNIKSSMQSWFSDWKNKKSFFHTKRFWAIIKTWHFISHSLTNWIFCLNRNLIFCSDFYVNNLYHVQTTW